MARSNKNKPRHSVKNFNTLSATPLTVARPIGLPKLSRLPSVTLSMYEDRRQFTPEPYTRVAFALPRKAAQLVVKQPIQKPTKPMYPGVLPTGVSFRVPDRVAICVRRGRRKEVLFALNKTGKGARSPKKRNSFSKVSCK